MRLTRIHTHQALTSNACIELEPGPSQHLARALRLQVGDSLILFDGHGGEYPAAISAVDKKKVTVNTGEWLEFELESNLHIHLGVAISRGDRMDLVVQKATELGVAAITPLLTERTGVRLSGERAAKKVQHWRQVSISACEQCGRNRLPTVHALQKLETWATRTDAERKFVLHHRARVAAGRPANPSGIALLVGPEGGLSDGEIQAAEQAGFESLSLGPRVLRTETAPLAGIAILQARWGDMSVTI